MFLHIIKRIIIHNTYFLLGITMGIILPRCLDHSSTNISCENEFVNSEMETFMLSNINNEDKPFSTNIPKSKKSSVTKKDMEKFVRPRYYSTELGIREKLFVGVLTSEDKINTQAIYINKTITHIADKVKFFITVRNKMNAFNLSGIVGFTDTRHKYRAFQVIKYIGDNFMQDYDYYFLMNDYNYLNIRRLKEIVEKISVSNDVYLGNTVEDSSFCNLDDGIILSNSVMHAMRVNLEWCINNAISNDHSENIGRCIHHSISLECQQEIQGQRLKSYKLKHFQLEKYFTKLARHEHFNKAVTIYPILQAKDFFLLNAYFSRQRLKRLKLDINELSQNINNSQSPGQKVAVKPATRFDLPLQFYFNATHMFAPDDFTNIKTHTAVDYLDIQKVIAAVKNKVLQENGHSLDYRRLINGYRIFDLSRGMDYILDLGFRDLNTGKEVVKRFEICKLLGKTEFVSVPYVTESTRVTILLPIQETEVNFAVEFVAHYSKIIMEHSEKALLMLVLLYQNNSTSKGLNDVFGKLKQMAVKLSSKFRSEETKIVWVSIRLPASDRLITLNDHKILNFAIIDLALKKVGLETLTVILDVYANISVEFLNRVRMNTIAGFQVFSPIPFRQYNPKVSKMYTFDVNKNVGHFDREQHRYISFYGKDYVFVRKKAQQEVPIIRLDSDIAQLIQRSHSGNIFELFLKYSDDLHCMRATEKELKVRYHEELDFECQNLFLGTKVQLAKLLLEKQDGIGLEF